MPGRQTTIVLLLCALTLTAQGCRKRGVKAAPPPVAPAPAPEPAPAPPAPASSEAKKPETPPETTPTPAPTPASPPHPARPAPVRPRPVPPEPVPPEPVPPKPAPPQISPRLSREEQAAAERQTQQAISEAEKNLQAAYGKKLNDAHQDLVEKIRGFLGQAREAMRAADWVRARNLAQKARSEERRVG